MTKDDEIEQAKQRLYEAVEELKNAQYGITCSVGEETLGGETPGDREDIDIPDGGEEEWSSTSTTDLQ